MLEGTHCFEEDWQDGKVLLLSKAFAHKSHIKGYVNWDMNVHIFHPILFSKIDRKGFRNWVASTEKASCRHTSKRIELSMHFTIKESWCIAKFDAVHNKVALIFPSFICYTDNDKARSQMICLPPSITNWVVWHPPTFLLSKLRYGWNRDTQLNVWKCSMPLHGKTLTGSYTL